MTAKPAPFVDPPRACTCAYCANTKLREFIDGGLQAARDADLPRPQVATVHRYVEAEGFAVCKSTVGNWLEHCAIWKEPWPGESGG